MMSVWVPGKTYISIVKNFCCFDDSLGISAFFVIFGVWVGWVKSC